MRSLFLKIFLSYWAAQALFVALAITVTLALRPQLDSPRWEAVRQNVAQRAVQIYEQSGAQETRRFLDETRHTLHVDAFLFDEHGQEITGRPVPPWRRELQHGPGPQNAAPPRDVPFIERIFPEPSAAATVEGAGGRQYRLVMALPPGPRFFLRHERFSGIGILIAVLTSGLVCFFLARHFTSPVVRLRAATRQLAAGDLTARAGAPARRNDEIAQLMRDFDTMAERLESLVNAQSRLINDISHELRSPLARLQVALGLARQKTGPEAASTLARIELEANRLNEMIGRLLTLSRLESGEPSIDRVPLSLAELIREIAQDATFEAQSRKCRVVSELDEDWRVNANASLLRSAIENVVRNAIRYTGEGTAVEIRLTSAPDHPREAIIRVIDRGPGVPAESLEKLFRPFYRLDDARNRASGGVGLGLAITERAVRLHGGSVQAMNRDGGGLIVELRLPGESVNAPQPTPAD